ncbi:MAG: TonB-dependent receptor [Acidobacteria bacterium]|nr:TonB-dependent receptor [Acidobacteriota bacterium]
MKIQHFSIRGIVQFAALIAFLCSTGVSLLAQERTGEIVGTVKDPSGAMIVGSTVTVTNNATGREFTATTGSDGNYYFRQLEPGRYTVRFDMEEFTPVEVADVSLLLGKTLRVDTELEVAPITESITVVDSAPLIDLSSTAVGHSVTSEESDRLPKARGFQGLLLTSPSVTSGVDQHGEVIGLEGGFQVNGASSAENQFNIDGVSATSLVNGWSRQNAVFEFVQEVQVKTSGIEAEYGGAIGGVLSAVTKSGGSSFHGDLHYYFAGNGISAGPIKRLLLDRDNLVDVTSPQDDKQGDNLHEFGGSLGGYFVQDKLWFFAAASPQWRRQSRDYLFSNGAERGTIKQKSLSQNLFGKISYDPFVRMRTYFTWLYTPSASTGRLPDYDAGPNQLSSSLEANESNKTIGTFQPQSSYTGNLDFILNNKMILTVRGGRYWDNYKSTGIPGFSSVVYQMSTSFLDPTLLANVPPEQQGDAGFLNTPRVRNTTFDIVTRSYIQADLGVYGHLLGDHDIKMGIGTMKNVNKVDNTYPGGGYVLVHWGSTFQGASGGNYCKDAANQAAGRCTGTYGYYEVNDNGVRGSAGGNISNFYIQDKWRVHPRLTLSLGVRFENETVPSFKRHVKDTAIEFGFADKVAPRLGFAYDYFGDGQLKLSFSWGRFYDWVKYDIARGLFGGQVWNIYYRTLDTPDAFSLSGTNTPGNDIYDPSVPNSHRDRRPPSFGDIDPEIKPMSTDIFNAGVDYQLGSNIVVSARYVHNRLRRTMEDGLARNPDGKLIYSIGNPGEGRSRFTYPFTATERAIPTPKPVRTYNALELSLTRRFSSGWFANASYVFSRLYGNYSGLAATEEVRPPTLGLGAATAQQQGASIMRPGGNVNAAYDIDEVLFDSHGNLDVQGRLPTDRPHALKLYGSKEFGWGTEVGAFFRVSSGTPLTTYVNTGNEYEVFVEGRGDMGRTPVLNQTDMMVAQTFNIAEGKTLRVEFNILNLFNQKTARHKFNWLNRGAGGGSSSSAVDLSGVDLYQGYDYKTMIANTPDGQNPALGALDPRYGKEELWSPGFQGRFGIKFTF